MTTAAAERSTTRAGSPASFEGGGGKNKARFHLDLDNFDADDVPDDCPYVLTSPRSLEACKRLRVQVSCTNVELAIGGKDWRQYLFLSKD